MYKLFDIELNKELVSSIAYILLSCGANIKNKNDFDTIIYKFYNFAKDELNFDNGIVITTTLKSKIVDFVNVINDLPNPSTKGEYIHAFDMAGKKTSADVRFEEDYYNLENVGDIHMAEGIIYNNGTTFSPAFCLEGKRRSDNYISSKRVETKSFTEDFAYAKVGFKYYSTSYVYVIIELYDENDSLITTYEKSGGNSTPHFKDYDITIKYIYDYSSTANVYSHYKYLACNDTIHEDTFTSVKADNLNVGDKYYASDVIENKKFKYDYCIHNIKGKTLNDEKVDNPYAKMLILLNKDMCAGDKLTYKYLTVMKEQEGNTLSAFVSTKQFYYTGDTTDTSGCPCFGNISNADSSLSMYFQWYKSVDNGENWTIQTTTIGSSANSFVNNNFYHKMDYRYPIYENGYDVVYSTYPIMYAVTPIKVVTEENIGKFDTNKRLKVWHNADEDFTLFDLAPGTTLYFGKYRVEDSPLSPITFAVTNFDNSLDRVCVLATHKLEYMCYNTKETVQNTRDKGYSPKADLYQWLNSDKKGSEWWQQYYDSDLPPTAENCLAGSNGHYFHKSGFLSGFSSAEKSIMEDRQLNFGQYTGSLVPENIAKVHIPSMNEIGVSNPSHLTGKAKYMYLKAAGLHNNLKHHLNNFDDVTFEDGDGIGSPISTNTSIFLRYDHNFNIGTADGSSSSASFVSRDKACFVQPFMVLKNAKVNREPDENGIFSLNFEQEPPQDVVIHSDIERNVVEESTVSYDVDRNVVKTVVKEFDVSRVMKFNVFGSANILRNVTYDFSRTHQIIRHLHNKTIKEYDIERNKTVTIIRRADIERQVIGFMTRKHNVFREVLEDFRKNYDVERNVRHCFDVVNEYDIERNVLINHITLHNILRDINIDYLLSSDIIRDVYQAEVFYGNVVRDVLAYYDKEFSVERNVRTIDDIAKEIDVLREIIYYVRTPYDIIRNVRMNLANEFDVIRTKIRDNATDFDVERTIVASKDTDYDVERLVNKEHIFEADVIRDKIESVENIHDILREVLETATLEGDIERSITRTLRREHNVVRLVQGKTESGYDICRDIVKDSAISSDIERHVVEDFNIEHDVMRQLLISVANEFDAIRDVLLSKALEVDILRDVLVNTDSSYDVERLIGLLANKEFDICREVLSVFAKEAAIERNVIKNIETLIDMERNVVVSISNLYDILRNSIIDCEFNADVFRDTLSDIINDFDVIRDTLEDFACESDVERALFQDIVGEYQAIRNVLSSIENEFDVERTVTLNHIVDKYFDVERTINTEDAYVSRENLQYYTIQLKKKIDEYINVKVEQMLEEKLRERFK